MSNLEATEEGKDWDVLLLGALGCVHPNQKYGLNRIHAAVRRTTIALSLYPTFKCF